MNFLLSLEIWLSLVTKVLFVFFCYWRKIGECTMEISTLNVEFSIEYYYYRAYRASAYHRHWDSVNVRVVENVPIEMNRKTKIPDIDLTADGLNLIKFTYFVFHSFFSIKKTLAMANPNQEIKFTKVNSTLSNYLLTMLHSHNSSWIFSFRFSSTISLLTLNRANVSRQSTQRLAKLWLR